MRKILNTMKRFRKDEEGAAMIEYAVLLGIILAVGVTVFTNIGSNTSAIFTSVKTLLAPPAAPTGG